MIKFKAKEENRNTGTIGSYRDNLDAILSGKLASQLNSKGIDFKCEFHSNEDSIILVNTPNNSVQFEIEHVCCEVFRPKLEHFLERQK